MTGFRPFPVTTFCIALLLGAGCNLVLGDYEPDLTVDGGDTDTETDSAMEEGESLITTESRPRTVSYADAEVRAQEAVAALTKTLGSKLGAEYRTRSAPLRGSSAATAPE